MEWYDTHMTPPGASQIKLINQSIDNVLILQKWIFCNAFVSFCLLGSICWSIYIIANVECIDKWFYLLYLRVRLSIMSCQSRWWMSLYRKAGLRLTFMPWYYWYWYYWLSNQDVWTVDQFIHQTPILILFSISAHIPMLLVGTCTFGQIDGGHSWNQFSGWNFQGNRSLYGSGFLISKWTESTWYEMLRYVYLINLECPQERT